MSDIIPDENAAVLVDLTPRAKRAAIEENWSHACVVLNSICSAFLCPTETTGVAKNRAHHMKCYHLVYTMCRRHSMHNVPDRLRKWLQDHLEPMVMNHLQWLIDENQALCHAHLANRGVRQHLKIAFLYVNETGRKRPRDQGGCTDVDWLTRSVFHDVYRKVLPLLHHTGPVLSFAVLPMTVRALMALHFCGHEVTCLPYDVFAQVFALMAEGALIDAVSVDGAGTEIANFFV